MYCNPEIHNNLEQIICPFCDRQINEYVSKREPCCDQENINNNVCINCGSTNMNYTTDYILFHENMYKIRKKSIYQRKYHINNIITKMCETNYISPSDKNKIITIFVLINQVLPYENRIRMINIHFILKKIFQIMDIEHNHLKISKSQKTLSI